MFANPSPNIFALIRKSSSIFGQFESNSSRLEMRLGSRHRLSPLSSELLAESDISLRITEFSRACFVGLGFIVPAVASVIFPDAITARWKASKRTLARTLPVEKHGSHGKLGDRTARRCNRRGYRK
jgi:hypothetical protein